MLVIILGLIVISISFATLGCVALWRKYVYFGDGLSHASFLGASVASIGILNNFYSGIAVSIAFSTLVFVFKKFEDNSAIVNLISSIFLASGILILHFNPNNTIGVNSLLFGDILSIATTDLYQLLIMMIINLVFIATFFNSIVKISINSEIAFVSGVYVQCIDLLFLILLGFSIFSAIKIAGTLLVISILLIPGISASYLASNPFHMILISIFMALTINIVGFALAFFIDIPLAPAIVITGFTLHIVVFCVSKSRN